MSTVALPPRKQAPDPRPEPPVKTNEIPIEEKVVHGWRTVTRRGFDGSVIHFDIPLYAEDVLHPLIGDQIMCASAHQDICRYLGNVANDQTSATPTTIVLTDTGVDLDLPDVATISPDVAVIPNVRERKNWSVFFCKEEGTKPNLMVEVTSPYRRENDTEKKFDFYFKARIPCYVIIDLANADENGVPPIFGYEWAESGYRPMVPDAQGRLWLDAIRVWIAAKPNGVVCFDENNVEIPDFDGARQAQRKAEERAQNEAKARQDAEAQVQALQAELAKLRGDAKTP